MFLENKYTKWYFNLVQKAKERNSSKGEGVYLEEHHIIPKSIGGSNESDNLVLFTAREHYIAHRLLTKMFVGQEKQKMCMALFCMVTLNDARNVMGITVKSKLYEKIRSDYTTLVSGENHFNYGLVRSEETRAKIREKRKKQVLPKEHYDRMSIVMKTKVWVNNGKQNKRVPENEIEQYEKNGYVKGRTRTYITEEFRNKFKVYTTEQWKKVKQSGHTGGHLIKLQ